MNIDDLRSLLAHAPPPKLKVNRAAHSFEPGEVTPETLTLIAQACERGLKEVFTYCLGFTSSNGGPRRVVDERGLQTATRRFIAIAWLLHSELLVGPDGVPLTLQQLSKLPQVDCTRCALSLLAQRFGKRFAFQSRVQKRQGGKVNYAQSAKEGWTKRRARKRSTPQLGDS
jgi:hypothetical protein